jgi:iron complex transport system substrate-binding protein
MVQKRFLIVWVFFILLCVQCKTETANELTVQPKNTVHYANGFSIENFDNFTWVTVRNPWPNAKKAYHYVLHKKGVTLPDTLKNYSAITIPVKKMVVTSTTHIPSLELLNEVNSLVGFPNLDYISSDRVRQRIEQGKVKELGSNQTLNTEVLIDLQPDVVVGYGIDNSNPTLDNIQKSGLKVILNGDWNEQTPLGRAEWIKFFGALYNQQKKAAAIFRKIEQDYLKTKALAAKAKQKTTVLAGDIFEGKWYLPKGDSWGSQLIKEAHGNYLWNATKGTGSLSLSFESVFEKGKQANLWITSGQFNSRVDMQASNPHYAQFKAFQNNQVYTFNRKKGKTGGSLYYELAPSRPDLVLKDLVKILHPELLPSYRPYFFVKLE